MPGTQRGKKNPSQRGDFTGNKKEALQKEHEETVEARREEIGLINAGRAAVKDEGVIDLMGDVPQVTFDNPDLQSALAEQLAARAPGDGPIEDATQTSGLPVDPAAREPELLAPEQPVPPQGTRLGGGKASIDVFELEPERPQATLQPGEALDRERLNEKTLIRAVYDLEDVTIGYGNNFTFRAGYRYHVPRWVAMHLEEKALCDVLSLSVA